MLKYLFLTIYFLSCAGRIKPLDGYEVVRFREKAFSKNISINQNYTLHVPKGGKLEKINTGDAYKEYRIYYPDSSVIYIMNDFWGGSRLNYENRYNQNIKAINRISSQDTLSFSGVQKNGDYWRENFVGEIVIGYINAKPSAKDEFEKSLSTLRKM